MNISIAPKFYIYNQKFTKAFVRFLLLSFVILFQKDIIAQTLTTTLSAPSMKVCGGSEELTIRLENSTALPLELGKFTINLDGLEYITLVSQTGSFGAPTVSFTSSPPALFALSGDLLVGDFVEFVISFAADIDQIAGGSYSINTTFEHSTGSVDNDENISIIIPADPQLQVTYTGSTSLNTCAAVQNYCITIQNISGNAFNVNNIRSTLSFPASATISNVTTTPNTIAFNALNNTLSSFDLSDNATATICFDMIVDCSASPGPISYGISLLYDPVCPDSDKSFSSSSPNITVNAATLAFSSPPSGTVNVNRGDVLTYNVNVNNSGTGTTNQGRYCMQAGGNLTLTSVAISGSPLNMSASAPSGYICFDLPVINAAGSATVTETWSVTGCTPPTVNNINRQLIYGCGSVPSCFQSPVTNNTVNILIPTNSMSINTVTPSLLSRCGKEENVTITLTHTGGPHDILTGIKGKLNMPAGFIQLSVSGGGVAYVSGQDSISIPNLSPGGSVTFTIKVRATCAVASGSYSFSFYAKNDPQPCILNNAQQVNTSFIPIQSADLSISGSTPATLTPFSGGVYMVTNTVANGGNGAIDSVYYCVQIHPNATLTAITIAGMNIPLFSSSLTENCYIIDRTLLDAALGVGIPYVNAVVQVVETWTFNSCAFPSDDLLRSARFGCASQTCSTSNVRATGVSFGDAIPEVSIALSSATRPACFVDNPSVVNVKISNTGTAPLAQLVYTITAGNNAIDVSSIQIRDASNNLITDQTIDITNSPAHCSGGVRTVRDTVRNVNIPAGSFIDIQYQLLHNCACTSGCSTNNIYNSTVRINSYTENCGFRFNVDDNVSTADYDAYINGFVEGTQDLFSSGSVQYTTTSMELDWFNGNYPNAYIETKFALPIGIDYTPNSIVWTDPNGLVFPVASETYVDGNSGAPDMLIVRWNNASRPVGFIFSGGNNFRFNVLSDCSERVVAGCSQFWDLNITAQTDLTIDPTCASCPTRCIWSNPSLNMRLHCPGPGPCTCEGMVFDNFQVERINFGIPDNNNDRNPDGATINMALVEKDRFITGDTLKAYFEGTVANTASTFTHGFAIVDLDHANFIPLSATVTILDASTATSFICNAVPITADFTNTRIIADFSPSALNALGCTIPAAYTFDNNDKITVTINYKINDPFTGIQRLITVPTQFYLSDMAFGLGIAHQCNVRQDRVSQIGIQRDRDMSSSNFGACDLPEFFIRERLYLGGISTDEFPYEIRQIGIPKEFKFTKPSEFVHREDKLGIRLTQNIDPGSTNIVNHLNGTIPSSFITISGNDLVLNTEAYITSLGNPRIPTDEGFTIDYYPRIQGSCKSSAGIYSYSFSQILGVDNELFGKDTLMVNPMTKTFEYLGGAQLVASASTVNVTICSASEDVNINVRNLTNFNAPNSFVTLRSPSGGLVGFDVLDASNNMIITPLPFGIYPLGNIGPNGSKDVILRVRANNCMRDSLQFVAGWSCENYPTTLEEALCADPSTVYFIPASSGLNMNVIIPAVDVITDLCNEVTYEVEILSTNLGFLRDIYFQAQFAPHETYVPGSIQMAYPSVSDGGTYLNIADPNPIMGGFDMDVSSLNSILSSVGLVGSKDLTKNKVRIKFRTVTSCNFASGSRARFLTNANSSCGDPLSVISKTAARIRVTSEPPSFNVDLALGDLTLNACNNQQGLSVVNMVLNSGSPSVNDSIKYILPPGISYVSGSYIPISNAVANAPLISINGGVQTLAWPFKPGLGLNSNISFSIQVEAIDIGQLCTDYTIVVQAYSTINDMCGAQTCNVGVIAGEGSQKVSIVKPKLKFQSLTGSLTLLPAPTNQVKATFNAKLLNMGAALQAGSTINMDIYDDIDANGSLSPGDVFVVTVSGTTTSVLLPNQTINLMGMGTFAAGVPSICSVIAVLDPKNTCTCDLETSFRLTPEIIVNMDNNPTVCSGATMPIGPQPTTGYNVEWVSIDGSSLALLSSTTSTPTNFMVENTSGVNQIIKYAIRTSGGNDCYVYDTITITVFPKNMDIVNVQTCQNLPFSLPAATIVGSNYIWVPTTGLTFPGPDNRFAKITSVAPGVTNYSLTYTDNNGCASSYDYIVTGIDCGTANTRIGDYVWFDINKNGIQDIGENPIVGMTVNLFNANNGVIVSSTTTDMMGKYLFDFLPQGNYFVQFVPLNGFMVTTPNLGIQGSNSVANATTGRSPNYFLPLDSETLYVDAGMVAMCNLDMNVSVGSCVAADASTLKRIVTVKLDWQNNVYTYPFLNGSDNITVNILGQTFNVPISTVNGTNSFTFDWQPATNTIVSATATFTNAPSCNATVDIGTFGPCMYDLALRKTIITPNIPAYKYGDVLQYRVEVFNQGTIPAANINVIDYKPAGLEFVTAQNLDWFLNTDNYSEAFIAGPILPGQSAFKDVYYKIIMNPGTTNAWTNYAEITYAEDNLGNDRSNYDSDSKPDKNQTNDTGGQPGTANDNKLDGDGINDEDDHDGASFSVFDLALIKTITTLAPYTFGQDVQFDITVFNQGSETANSFTIVDNIPAGYSYRPVNSPAWTLTGNVASRTIVNPLLPGASITIPIILRIEKVASSLYVNIAEISAATNSTGAPATDFDGVFDSNPANDPGGVPDSGSDNALNGNGTGVGIAALGDEDNMDVARLAIPDIELEKTVVSIAPAISGNVANNDVTFSLKIQNSGNEDLTMITLSDNFIAQFGGSFVRIVTMPSIFSSTATTNPVLNPAFNGGVNAGIFNGMSGLLAPGQNIVVRLKLELKDVNPADPLVNEAITNGKDRFGEIVRDTAQALVMLPNCFLKVNCPTPEQGTFSCTADVPAAALTVAAFNSAYGVNSIEKFCNTPTITFSDATSGTGCTASPRKITRTYTITDTGVVPIGGQSQTCTVIYTVIDNVKPVFVTPPCDLILECGAASNTVAINNWLTLNGKSVAADNCGQSVVITNSLVETNNTCGNTTIRKYGFTATDACGNNVVAFGRVILEDRIAPVLTLPTATNNVVCTGNIGTAVTNWINSASATDQCGGTVTITSAITNEIRDCNGVNTRIRRNYLFTATDNCGNATTDTATFTINDTTAPTITAPANLTVSCGQDIGAAVVDWLDNYTVTEACQSYTVSNNYTGILPDLCGGSQTITWTVTDGCGATGNSSAMIVVSNDATIPVFSNCPLNLTVNVDVDLCASNVVYSTPIATDCNGPVTVVRTSGIASGSTFPLGVSTIVFTATDRCNNKSTCSFTITVVDTDVPSITCPSNDVVLCSNGSCVWPSTTALNPIGIENCPGANVTYSIAGVTTGTGNGNVPLNTSFALGTSVVTYTITAANGQIATCSFNVVVNDCTAPVITCPSAQPVFECGSPTLEADINTWLATASATDNCTITPTETVTRINTIAQCGNTERRLYQITATDGSGNVSKCFVEVAITDNTNPIISTLASNQTVQCDGNGNSDALINWLNTHGGAIASDAACGNKLVWSNNFTGLSNGCGGTGTTTVNFTVADDCGNTAQTTASFTIEDTTNPTITAPAAITLLCGNTSNNAIVQGWLDSYRVSDACGNVTVTNNFTSLPTTCVSGSNSVTITFTATDECGRMSTTTSTITLVDNQKPIIMTPPTDLIVECGANNTATISAWVTAIGNAVIIDNCDPTLTTTFVAGSAEPTCGSTTTTLYTLTATDDCGNSTVTYARLILLDRIAPVLTLPTAANSVNCSPASAAETALTTWLNSATATDQCQGAITSISKSLVNTVRSCTATNGTNVASTYLFSVSDNCGNATTGTATFTINDTTAPTITAPANLTVACGQDIGAAVVDWLDNYTVTEACQSYTVSNNYTGILPNLCGGSQTITWTVTDGCGATGSSSAMIIVSNDTTVPVFSNCPTNLTVNVDVDLCASNVVYSTPIATDCNGPVTVVRTSGIASGSTFPLGVSTIVFTATDRCNNKSTCSFTITVVDTDVPSITCPSNDVVVCSNGSCVWPSTTALNPIGIENCPGANVTYSIAGVTTGTGNGNVPLNTSFALGTSVVTYTITAANGQIATCSFNVVVNDCTAPVITCPSAQPVFECGSPTLEADITTWLASATATDNCTITPTETVTKINTIAQCGNTERWLYQITATDGSGNVSKCFVEVAITDNTNPIISTLASNQTVQCDGNGNSDALINWLNTHGGAIASDAACGNKLVWSNNFTGLSNGCGGTGTTTVTFTVADDCGNTAQTTASFTIEDTTNPTITAPAAITLLCGNTSNNAIVQGWLDSYRVSDACGNVTVTNNFTSLPTTCVSGSNSVTITFTATDECGRMSTTTSTITLVDNQKPIIMTPPTDLIVECGANNTATISAWVTAIGNAVIIDNCDPTLTTTFVAGSAEPTCGSTTTTLYTLTATDDCGNSTVTYARLILLDRIAPVLTLPTASNSVNCSPASAAETALTTWLNSATARDQCQGTITSISKSLVNTVRSCTATNGTNVASTYLFSVSDNCGNATTGTATFTINDTTAPTITAPANLTVACGQDIGAAVVDWLDNYTVTEACQSYTVSNNYTGILPNLCGGSQTITWTVTDGCGATGSSSAMIVVSNDTTIPVFSNCPTNLTVNVDVDLCASNVVYSTPIATDCNGPVTVVRTSGIASGSTFPLGVSTIVFTATDRCNNTNTCSFTITVVDTDTPSITCPSNDVVVCSNGSCIWPSTTALNPIGIENCPGANVTYAITGVTTGTGNGNIPLNTSFALGTSVVTYTITAANGQTATCSFNVVVNDCTAPVITCPTNLTLECADATNNASINTWLTAATATDNCTLIPVETTLLLNTIDQCGNSERRLYRFTATDDSGNKSECFAEIIIRDTTIPTVSTVASNLTVDCDGNGNTEQLLNWLNSKGGAIASDLCGSVSWTNNFGSFTDLCASTGATTVIFTVSDECGNTNTTSATFTIRDITDPILSCPADITLECSNPFNNAIITSWLRTANAEDICSGTLQVTNNYPGTFVAGCGLSGVHTITFSTVDACGNDVICNRTITINDTTLPIITSPAMPMTVECDGVGNLTQLNTWLGNNAAALSTDLCSSPSQITWSVPLLVNTQVLCGGTSIKTYKFVAVDACNNESLPTFSTFTIHDITVPSISTQASNLTVECDGAGNTAALASWLNAHGNAIATDICSGPLNWTYNLIGTQDKCGRTGIYNYRFTVVDGCGNTSITDADFIIRDTTSPQIVVGANNFDAQCNGSSNSIDILNWLNNNGFAQANDVCNGITWTNDYGTIGSDCGTTGSVTVTFTATDACANTSTTAAIFSISDNTKPTWEKLPQNLTLTCDGISDPIIQITSWLNLAGGGEAKDSCSLVRYSNNFTALTNGCSAGTGSALVVFTATDACGNAVTASATVTVEDINAPFFTIQARDTIVECNGNGNGVDLALWLANHGGARAEDACSEPLTWANLLLSTTPNCGGTSSARYSFTVTDACGNISVTTEALFIIKDTIIPSFTTLPKDSIVQCDGSGNTTQLAGWLATNGGLVAIDLCGSISNIQYDLVRKTDLCSLTSRSLYRFTIVDACGNANTAEASYIIVDTIPPVITGGADMNMEECNNPLAGNYPEFDYWLTNHAGANALDKCSGYTWSNNYKPTNWVVLCGNTRSVAVTFYATDNCNNVDSVIYTFSIGDVTPPVFVNCPRPPVIVDAPAGWCSSFANFSPITATDNCSKVTITQIDKTGYTSGSLFPVGTTILWYEAADECGNKDTCSIKIIVNDFHTPPTITCPTDKTVNNDITMCGAVVNNLAPTGITDNCVNNTAITFTIRDSVNTIIGCGFNNASGFKFPVGKNTVNYVIQDQPILLITEIVNNGIISGIEITNFGPAKYDISCLTIERIGTSPEVFVVEDSILNVGGVYTHNFSNIPSNSPGAYVIKFLDNFIDGVAINGFAPSDFSWSGSLGAGSIFRTRVCDINSGMDFRRSDDCNLDTYGMLNPGLPILPDNGTVTSLQSRPPSIVTCNFKVTVLDAENPYCAKFDTVSYLPTILPIGINQGSCTSATFIIPVSAVNQVADINILNLEGSYPDMSALTFKLVSPQGTEVTLLSGICPGTDNFDINLDDEATNSLSSVLCTPAGQNGTYKPAQPLKKFFGERASGNWTLEIFTTIPQIGSLTQATLEIIRLMPYTQRDTIINNDTEICGASFTWQHARVGDNCCVGTIRVDYSSDSGINVPTSGLLVGQGGQMVTQNFNVGTTTVTYTITDQAGNVSKCSFDITVKDHEAPVLSPSSCADITIQLLGGQCETTVVYPIITATDNCKIDSIQYNPPVGHLFPIGTTEVQLVIFDTAGNSDTCTFDVHVLPYIPASNSLACKGEINLSLDATCTAYITASMVLAGTNVACYDNYCITLMNADGSIIGTNIDSTHKLDISHIGKQITVKICEDCSSTANCCWTLVNVEEKLIPQIECPANVTIQCNETEDPTFTGMPILKSCEPNLSITYEDEYTDNEYCGEPRAIIKRVWTVEDDENNIITCSQTITVERFEMKQIKFPADYVLSNAFDCDDVAKNSMLIDTSATGQPTIDGKNIYGDHLCEFNMGYWDERLTDVNCRNSYEILRHWTIRDECSPIELNVNPMRYIQAIKVNDRKAPVFTKCFDDVTISTIDRNCTGEYVLPSLVGMVSDGCGDLRSITVTVGGGTVIASGTGIFKSYRFTNMSVGTHVVKIKATDLCKNATTCEFTINIVDKTAPNAICDNLTVVALSNDGTARLKATVIDDGSYDNCGNVRLQIYRMVAACGIPADTIPGDDILLCCEDITSGPVRVILRAWDDADGDGIFGSIGDNFAECMTEVKVEYKLAPSFICPKDVTIDCTQDYEDLNTTGKPDLFTACNAPKVHYTDLDVKINDCGIGTLTRRWSVENNPGVGCDQKISVIGIQPVTIDSIVWPRDTTVTCLDILAGQNPIIKGGACDQIVYQVQADTFTVVSDACYKVLKQWTVIDWCQYELNNPSSVGKWTYTQTIKVIDTLGPTILNCTSDDIIINAQSCTVDSFNITASASDQSCGLNQVLKWNYAVDIDNNGSIEFTGTINGNNVVKRIVSSATKSAKVYWSVTDGCNNVSNCIQVYKVKDTKAPQAYCKYLAIAITVGGDAIIWAKDFDNGSTDECTPTNKLQFSFSGTSIDSSRTFTCADIPNGISTEISIPIWVYDESGNKALCNATLSLQDNANICPNNNNLLADIGGRLATETGQGVDSAQIVLQKNLVEPDYKTVMSNGQGSYIANDNAKGLAYIIKPKHNVDWLNGISTLDLVLIQRHILGLDELQNPYSIIAADVNNDGKVTASDLVALRKLILGIQQEIVGNESWKFIPKSFIFSDPKYPFPHPSTIIIDSLIKHEPNNDFTAVKIGDINLNADPSAHISKTENRSAKPFELRYGVDNLVENQNRVRLTFYSSEDISIQGFQMALNLQGSLPILEDGLLNISGHDVYFDGKELRVSYAAAKANNVTKHQPLFYLEMDKSNWLKLDTDFFKNEIYTKENLEIRPLKLSNISNEMNPSVFAVDQNIPNPFRDITKINFEMPEAAEVRFEVKNIKGELIFTSTKSYNRGRNTIEFKRSSTLVSGVYSYTLTTSKASITHKMIILE